MFIEILICVLIADFITGFFHWYEDTYGTISDSWLSKNIYEPNILHHKHPSWFITMSNFINRNYLQWAFAGFFLFIIYLLGFLCWQIILIAVLVSMSNEVHAWSHSKKNPFLVELLQDMCILQTKLHHAKHHIPPYNKNYCILTNWLNPILELFCFWRFLEYILSPFIAVKRGSPERQGY